MKRHPWVFSIFHFDREGRITAANHRFAEIVGSPGEVLVGLDLLQLPVPVVVEATREVLAGRAGNYEGTYKSLTSGREIWVTVQYAPLLSPAGETTGGVVIVEDITERKKAEEHLRESELKLRTIFERTLNPIFIADENGRYIDANQAALDFTECTRDELLGKNMWSFVPPDKLEIAQQEHAPFIDHRIIETQYLVNGQIKTLLLNVAPLEIAGKVEVFGIGVDVTASKEAREELIREKELLEVTVSSIGDAVIAVDTGGRVTLMNKVAENLTGWERRQATGKPLDEVFRIINEKTGQPAENPVRRVLASGRVVGLANHIALLARDGTRRSIADSAAPIRGRDGETLGVVLVFRDVTLERQQEEALIASEARLRLLTGNMMDMITQTDITGVIRYVSPSNEQLLGYPPQLMVGKSAFDFIHPEDVDRVKNAFRDGFARRRGGKEEYRFRRRPLLVDGNRGQPDL